MEITKVRDVKTPQRGTAESAGLDFFVPSDFNTVLLEPGESVKIPSGIKMRLPIGKAGVFVNKSGLGSKGLNVGACLVDSDYRGEVHLNVFNVSDTHIIIKPDMKLVQMMIYDVDLITPKVITNEAFEKFADTERGENGFGSTGE